jgi:hypothetical protein
MGTGHEGLLERGKGDRKMLGKVKLPPIESTFQDP